MDKKTRLMLLQIFLLLSISHLYSQEVMPSELDSLVENVRVRCKVPGIAVSIIKDGKVIMSKGFGINAISSKAGVNEKTLFGIASNTKAFTVMGLGVLVDENKLKWDDKVIKYIPELKMFDDCVTNQLTIRDLITHRTGLGFVSGNLMLVPYENEFNINNLIFNLRFLKPAYDFRTKFEYNDVMFVIAGEIISRVSGVSWEDFIVEKILTPLEMYNTFPSASKAKANKDISNPHVLINDKIEETSRDFSELGNPAGGIYSNLYDLNKWISMLINQGKYNGGRLVSEEVFQQIFSAQNIITDTISYGLGWFLINNKENKIATHEGQILGNYSIITIMPEKKIGIIVLTNQQSSAAIYGIENYLRNRYLGLDYKKVVDKYIESDSINIGETIKIENAISNELKKNINKKVGKTDLNDFLGLYTDNWIGNVKIFIRDNKLFFQSEMSPELMGEMFYHSKNKFVVRWINKNLYADAFVVFTLDNRKRVSGMKMEAISPRTDSSYDFQDLDFRKKNIQ